MGSLRGGSKERHQEAGARFVAGRGEGEDNGAYVWGVTQSTPFGSTCLAAELETDILLAALQMLLYHRPQCLPSDHTCGILPLSVCALYRRHPGGHAGGVCQSGAGT